MPIQMEDIIKVCKHVMECIVENNYKKLEEEGALSRVSESDIKRVLHDYNPNGNIIIPPDDYYKEIYVNKYNDGAGYHVDIDLWYYDGRSDLTLQIDIRKNQYNDLTFIVYDLRVF